MKCRWGPEELAEQWTLLSDELTLVGNKSGATRLGFAILLKAFQLEGCFPNNKSDIPRAVVDYVAKQINVAGNILANFDWTGRTARYHRAQIRAFFRFREATVEDAEALVEWLAHQEGVRDLTLEALLVTVYERCRELRLEPPTPDRMHRLTRMESQADTDPTDGEANDERITWYRLKADPGAGMWANAVNLPGLLDVGVC